jgi:hypothetical protein
MLTRYKHRRADGEESDTASALETAIDAHWHVFLAIVRLEIDVMIRISTIFLSSAEAQAGQHLSNLSGYGN